MTKGETFIIGTKGIEEDGTATAKEKEWICDVCYQRHGVRCVIRGDKPTECTKPVPKPEWREK